MIDRYDWAGGPEAMLRFGPARGPVVIAALPPFEEANRTRTFLVTLLRALAVLGVAGLLPDLPGTGESLVPGEEVRLRDWRGAFAAAARKAERPYSIAIRAGALIDTDAELAGRWHFAPQTGSALVRELLRTRSLVDGLPEGVDLDDPHDNGRPLSLAGNMISRALLRDLHQAEPAPGAAPLRRVALAGDPAEAELRVEGTPLWRRSEPANDSVLAQTLARDIRDWIESCGG